MSEKKTKTQNEFSERLEVRRDELKWLYCELYHGDEEAYRYFEEMLRRCWEERKLSLRKLDAAREADPDWYRSRGLLGMMLYVDNFAGDLKGVKEKLPYLKECGVNYLHLMPLLASPKGRSDGGYAVADFRAVQTELGTMEDMEALTDACRKDGISVCLDFVMNHTSEDHEWAKKARAGEPGYRDRYFFYDDWTVPMEYEKTVPQVFPTTAPGSFTWLEDCRQVVMTSFYPYQWDLNYANPAVFNDMCENMFYLTNRGIDVIRLDATPYIWKELGTDCRNLPQVHTLVRMMRLACEIVCPAVLLLGEVVMEPAKVVPYFGTREKPECHMLYNVTTMASTWHTLATGEVALLRRQLDIVSGLPKEFTFLNYLRCHDDIGWGLDYPWLSENFGIEQVPHKRYLNDWFTGKLSDSRGELYNDDPRLGDARLCGTAASLCGVETAEIERDPFKLERAVQCDLMLHAWMLTQSGIPVVYSGDEVGQLNDYTYHESDDPEKRLDSRNVHRGRFPWEQAELRRDGTTRQGKQFQGLRRLEEIRKGEPAFDARADVWTFDTGSPNVLGVGRWYRGRKLIALFNFSQEFVSVQTPERESFDELVYGQHYGSAEHLNLWPCGFMWLLRTEETQG